MAKTSLEGNTNQIPNLSSGVVRCRHIREVLKSMMATHGHPSRPDWSWDAHSEWCLHTNAPCSRQTFCQWLPQDLTKLMSKNQNQIPQLQTTISVYTHPPPFFPLSNFSHTISHYPPVIIRKFSDEPEVAQKTSTRHSNIFSMPCLFSRAAAVSVHWSILRNILFVTDLLESRFLFPSIPSWYY